jgi:hypothetical protein
LMRISAEFGSSSAAAPWATAEEAVAWVQHEMERRFAQVMFDQAGSPRAERGAVPVRSYAAADPKITELWRLRTWFGDRNIVSQRSEFADDWVLRETRSARKPFAELPAEVQAGIVSAFGTSV